ncbi:MAG TPA: (Fe-S)-binding protein [Gammaproteobacteria bacterium]|nr:(Fe-S)-binding protein [Gammaproteobacteria bacterium]
MSKDDLVQVIDTLASQCVKCGLCLPHCPTYNLDQNENESPRGRISLLQALVQEKLPTSESVLVHLDRCLTCRHCERVCPAHVDYGNLISKGRYWVQRDKKRQNTSFKTKLLAYLVQTPRKIKWAGLFLYLLEITRLRALAQQLGIPSFLGLSNLDQLLPTVPKQKSFRSFYAHRAPYKGSVGLFLGCLSRWCDREIPSEIINIVTRLGFDIYIPQDQGCCGALAEHQGFHQDAKKLVALTQAIFEPLPIDTILTFASGCGAMLLEQSTLSVKDISDFLLPYLKPEYLHPLPYRVALHTPCTLINGMHKATPPHQILQKIPGLACFLIKEDGMCCGSAGSYMLEQPERAVLLANKIIDSIPFDTLDYLVTSNIGCALHFRRILNLRGIKLPVVHPISLVAKAFLSRS